MRISEMTQDKVQQFIRAEDGVLQPEILAMAMESARTYMRSYTGLELEELDEIEEMALAFLVLVQDMYDNRTMHPDTKYANSGNKTVQTILDMHRRNLL